MSTDFLPFPVASALRREQEECVRVLVSEGRFGLRRYRAGETIVAQGDDETRAFFIRDGWGSVSRNLRDGERQLIEFPIAGDIHFDDSVEAWAGLAARGLFMMGRLGALTISSSDGCSFIPQPVWTKSRYKFQLMEPVKAASASMSDAPDRSGPAPNTRRARTMPSSCSSKRRFAAPGCRCHDSISIWLPIAALHFAPPIRAAHRWRGGFAHVSSNAAAPRHGIARTVGVAEPGSNPRVTSAYDHVDRFRRSGARSRSRVPH